MMNSINDIKITDDNYIEISLENKVSIDSKKFSLVNSDIAQLINCTKDRYEENNLLYYVGEYASLKKYIENKEFDFSSLKKFLLELMENIIKIQEKKLNISSLILEMEYVFVDKYTDNLKLIYVPVEKENQRDCKMLQKLLKELASNIKIKGSSELIGLMLSKANSNNFDAKVFKSELIKLTIKNSTNSNSTTNNKAIQASLATILSILVLGLILPGIAVILGYFPVKNAINLSGIIIMGSMYLLGSVVALIICFLFLNKKQKMVTSEPKAEEPVEVSSNYSEDINIGNLSSTTISETLDYKTNTQSFGNKEYNPNIKANSNAKAETSLLNISSELEQSSSPSEGTQLLFNYENRAYIIKNENGNNIDKIFIDDKQFSVGREKNSVDYVLEDRSISKKHATFKTLGEEYFIIDNSSSNGTYLNGKRLQAEQEYKIKNGDIVSFAKQEFQFYDK